MGRFSMVAGVFGGIVLASSAVAAAEDFDNPATNGAPCVFLDRYEVDPVAAEGEDGRRYRAEAMIQNVCGRALEVQFCFQYAPNDAGAERNCHEGSVRPWSKARVVEASAPARVTGPSYQWRYLP